MEEPLGRLCLQRTREGAQEEVGVEEGVGHHWLAGVPWVGAQGCTLLLVEVGVEGQQNQGGGGRKGVMGVVGSPQLGSLQVVAVEESPSSVAEAEVQEAEQNLAGLLVVNQWVELVEGGWG